MKRIHIVLFLAVALFCCGCGSRGDNAEALSQPQDSTFLGMAPEMDSLYFLCINDTSTDPIAILEEMMSTSFCPMHGPIHHCLAGLALLTAYHNAGGEVDLTTALPEMMRRGQTVPGAACGKWGACGAALSCGMFMSLVTDNSPFATEAWHLSNLCTAQALESVANHGGPRCCKRDSYLAVLSTVDFVGEHLGVTMHKADVRCTRSAQNEQCIGKRCPFAAATEE